jgi:hypothetical protein
MQGYEVTNNSSAFPLIFLLIQSSDHINGLTGASPTVTISKNGGAFASPSGAVTQIGNGWYKVAGNATDTNTLGPIALHATATGSDPCDMMYPCVANNPQDAVRYGLSALPNANAQASGGLATIGTGAGQMNVDGAGNVASNAMKINNVATTPVTTIGANIGTTQPINFTGTAGSALVQTDTRNFLGHTVVLDPNFYPSVNIADIGGTATAGAAGYVGIDWGHINAPASGVNLSLTTIGQVSGSVGSISGITFPSGFSNLTVAAIATTIWQDTTAGDFTVTGSPGKILVGQLGGTFTTTTSSVFSAASLVNAPTGGTAPTVGQIATAVWQDMTAGDFAVSGSIGKSLYTSGNAPGAANGLHINGANVGPLSVSGGVTFSNSGGTGFWINDGMIVLNANGTAMTWQATGASGTGLECIAGNGGTAASFYSSTRTGGTLQFASSGPGTGSGLAISGSDSAPAIAVFGPWSTAGPVVLIDATAAGGSGLDGGPGIKIQTGAGDGVNINATGGIGLSIAGGMQVVNASIFGDAVVFKATGAGARGFVCAGANDYPSAFFYSGNGTGGNLLIGCTPDISPITIHAGHSKSAISIYGSETTPGPVILIDATAATDTGLDGGPGIKIQTGAGDGITITAGGTGANGITSTGGSGGFGLQATINPPISASFDLTQALNAARALDSIADTNLTINDAFHCAIAGAVGKKDASSGTNFIVSTTFTGTPLRTLAITSIAPPSTVPDKIS